MPAHIPANNATQTKHPALQEDSLPTKAQAVEEHPVPNTPTIKRRGRAIVGATAAVLVVAGLTGAGGWALGRITAPPQMPAAEKTSTVITAETGTIQRNAAFPAKATWSGATPQKLTIEGTVTARHLEGVQTIGHGSKLFDVNLKPVYIAAGKTPAFREIGEGASGADVRQMQEFIRSQGIRSVPRNGVVDEKTVDSIKKWQKKTKQEETGKIAAGQLIFMDALPRTGYISKEIAVGQTLPLAGGASEQGQAGAAAPSGLVFLPSHPTFTLELPEAKTQQLQPDMAVTLQVEDQRWDAVIETINSPKNPGDPAIVKLKKSDGQPICADHCGKVPPTGLNDIPAQVTIIPATSGTKIPTTAITVGPAGQTAVTLADGRQQPVTVKASYGGHAIVEGITPGQKLTIEMP